MALLLQGCTTTFMGSVFVLGFRDILLYVMLAFVFAVLIALKSNYENRRTNFWIWFIVGLILTPLAGFIYLLITLTRRRDN
ncbi:MAG: hypothetical protein JWO09_3426 [Bacteroidetes bacterium]|nr:hypothetical protein [Bacteroidota bacterium]